MGLIIAFGVAKVVRFLTRLRGGGSAFPGLVVLRLLPHVLERTLGGLRRGVIFVTGSNGKSTTTTMLAGILRAHGLKVFTNSAGGNLPQGLASALVGSASLRGRLPADIAVLEVDEAYGTHIAHLIQPRWVVITNIQVDQLNRFGEPEAVYRMLRDLSRMVSAGVLVNGGDPNAHALGSELEAEGFRVEHMAVSAEASASAAHGLVPAPLFFERLAVSLSKPVLSVVSVAGAQVDLDFRGSVFALRMPQPGLHYAVDTGLAAAMASVVLDDGFKPETAIAALEVLTPVYGRGETITYKGRDIALIMMKNLPSLQANLDAVTHPLENVWISVDEGTPDPSWIFDTDTSALSSVSVLSGTKAWQWVSLLEHRGIPYGHVVEDTKAALERFVAEAPPSAGPLNAIVNYEQMMRIRRLAGYKELEGTR